MSRRPATFTQAEIGRAIRAANKAGPNMAVEILPKSGVIRIVSTSPRLPESEQVDEDKVIPL